MKLVCEKDRCTACGACAAVCPRNAVSIQDTVTANNALIDLEKCIHCNLCERVCQVNHPLSKTEPLQWQQGWANDTEIRRRAASGGFATAIMQAFVKNGGAVYSCCLKQGEFVYDRADQVNQIQKFTGSKYVKSNPDGVYTRIVKDLKNKQKVLLVGLPCHVAAMKKFVGEALCADLYTVDLICHGSPSPKILNRFLAEHGYSLKNAAHILFRSKEDMSQLKRFYTPIEGFGMYDKYSFAFLEGFTCTENCYECQYASPQRISDVTLGDSWGSDCTTEERQKGISLVLCNTEKGKVLLEMADLHREPVDISRAIACNAQLKRPANKPPKREAFMTAFLRGRPVDKIVWKLVPKVCAKAEIKRLCLKMHFIKGGTVYSILVANEKETSA